ncbi:hypothetical protein [Megasphaera elsdenii]|uniref:Uncharacterized protein n=1 Tax=Megasphaera elsdenii TaxID=907 RepID=A0A848EVH2_MEGEL|nr:hypothetical protein [Megasphaera elsdenii]NMK39892.1 hypothetical protein [Megasphaera elsdenii]
MIDDKMAKMAINTLKEYCNTSLKTCNKCAVKDACCMPCRVFGNMNEINDVGTFENMQKSAKKPIKFDETMKESKDFMVYLWALLEEVTETTIGDYDRQHMEIDVNKYGKVTIDLKNNTGRVVAHGDARCHPNDTFNIKTGMKIAAERMIEELKKSLHPRNDDSYYYMGDYGPVHRICKDEFFDRLNDVMSNCFNNPAVALEHETEIRYRKENILRIIADYMKKR